MLQDAGPGQANWCRSKEEIYQQWNTHRNHVQK
jgi:hypothetical protein